MNKKITPHTFPKFKPNPIFQGLPDSVKDPKNYAKIQKALIETLATPHSHSDVLTFYQCLKCQGRVTAHRNLMKKLGFTSGAQYLSWKKVMHQMLGLDTRRDPLLKKNATNKPQ